MSYCRWSSNDFDCDVYCYESSSGYEIHVANRRCVFAEPLPPLVPYEPENPQWPTQWVERSRKVSEMVERATWVPIGLPFDGKSFTESTAEDCADRGESSK